MCNDEYNTLKSVLDDLTVELEEQQIYFVKDTYNRSGIFLERIFATIDKGYHTSLILSEGDITTTVKNLLKREIKFSKSLVVSD